MNLEICLAQERLNELTNENVGLAQLTVEKDNGLKEFQSEIDRLTEELRVRDIHSDVGYNLQFLYVVADLIQLISAQAQALKVDELIKEKDNMSRALLIEIEERERIETRLVTELETHKAVSVTIDN